MPTVDENLKTWNETYRWIEQGDEWSRSWGGPSAQWFGTILPRLRTFVPTGTILEIAPGFGRWTQFLARLCDELVVVDLSTKCIEACRRRFAADFPNIAYHVNDGRSLAMVPDDSVDLVFSFDSLVHVESEVLDAYLEQIATKLKPDGVAFLHHSNLGEYVDESTGRIPESMGRAGSRDASVSGTRVIETGARASLCCLSQELVPWGGVELIDAITVFARPGSRWGDQTVPMRNPEFAAEVRYVRKLGQLYDWGPMARGRQDSNSSQIHSK